MGSAAKDVYLEPLEHAAQNSLILGLFLPLQSGAWSPSTAPRGTS
jgi:FMNH2-dependent dimethyl sulfone monooxygenase